MPPNIPLPANAVVECTLKGTYEGQQIMTVLHYQWTTIGQADGTDELNNLNSQLTTGDNAVWDKIRLCQNDGVDYYQTRVQVIHPTRQVYLAYNYFGEGDRPISIGLPANVNAVITKRVMPAGRGRSGSVHICGLNGEDMLAGLVQPGLRDLLDAVAAVLPNYLSAVGPVEDIWKPVSFSLSQAANPGEVFAAVVERESRVMRRRTVGQGI